MRLDPATEPKIKVTKLDAAKRQLKTAIRLWFNDDDQVAVHTLVAAAYDILHTLSRRKGAKGLLFDTPLIKKEHRGKWVARVKQDANFFKHADHDSDGEIEFVFIMNELFMLFCAGALEQMREPPSLEVSAFLSWIRIHRAGLLSEDTKSKVPIKPPEEIRGLQKKEFFESCSVIWLEHYQGSSI